MLLLSWLTPQVPCLFFCFLFPVSCFSTAFTHCLTELGVSLQLCLCAAHLQPLPTQDAVQKLQVLSQTTPDRSTGTKPTKGDSNIVRLVP